MLIFLDTNIVIYAVEYPAVFGPKALARLQALGRSDRIAVSELTRMECCSFPLGRADFALLRLYDSFFLRPDVTFLPLDTPVFRRASLVQAVYDIGTVDALHLGTALEHGCQAFLTHDQRLKRCSDLVVEVLM